MRMPDRVSLALVVLFTALPVSAQDSIPRVKLGSVHPPNRSLEYFADIDKLDEIGFWDAFERSFLARELLGRFKWEFGVQLADISTVRGTETCQSNRQLTVDVVELRGRKAIALPPVGKESRIDGCVRSRVKIGSKSS